MTLAVPTINLNGTSRERRVEALVAAHRATDGAVEALKQTAPASQKTPHRRNGSSSTSNYDRARWT